SDRSRTSLLAIPAGTQTCSRWPVIRLSSIPILILRRLLGTKPGLSIGRLELQANNSQNICAFFSVALESLVSRNIIGVLNASPDDLLSTAIDCSWTPNHFSLSVVFCHARRSAIAGLCATGRTLALRARGRSKMCVLPQI